jgi:hypothetical protein
MKRASMVIAVIIMASACGLDAQDANPISTNLKQDWSNVSSLLSRMADKMPEEDYRFKPKPEVQDFGQRMAHVSLSRLLRQPRSDNARNFASGSTAVPSREGVVN